MAHEIKVKLTPDIGRFWPDTFDHLLQLQVTLPGLDTRFVHTLIAAAVADDGSSAELTVHSEPIAPTDIGEGIRFLNGTPMARVRVVSEGGDSLIAEQQLNAPLQPGQRITVAGNEYLVTHTDWPGRDPVTGVCSGDVDWQHAHVVPVEAPVSVPMLARPAGAEPEPVVAGGALSPDRDQPQLDRAGVRGGGGGSGTR